ncbi:glycosyltransferase family 4 protein [Metabacillus arenae]|uniref:Glycosyltransferase family 4 protein n=1 Tax=Metabacillus arenae TaxID=2771434 RepID=A0A926NL06_9BACI|nr:glycosyltransferase family 1 protein [Metabacillus arenae]MBD1382680.1 glycosyltransferase family 4 protein [Metabacillus arenae]
MNVYINGRFLTQRVTGVQRFALEIIKRLDKQVGVSFTILVPPNYQETHFFQNINIKQIGRYTGHPWEQLDLPIYVKEKPLINFCNTGPIFKRNQIVVVHDTAIYAYPEGFSLPFRIWYKMMFTFFKILSKKILTISQFSRKELIKYLKINPKKLELISEGKEHFDSIKEDNTILSKFKLKKNKYILAVSSLNPNKNFKALIDAIKYLTEEDFEVVIAGGTDIKVFNKVNIGNDKIKQVGYVTDEDLKGLYMNAGCFVFPSIYEGFGLPPLEAMSTGCPVLVSNVGPMPEVSGEAAIYFNPKDSKELAEKIKYVMNNADVKKELQIKGLQQAKKFSWETAANQLIVYTKSLKG